jgi:hypothetical protein
LRFRTRSGISLSTKALLPRGDNGRVPVPRGKRLLTDQPPAGPEDAMKKLFVLMGFALAVSATHVAWATSSEEATKIITAAYQDILGRKPDDEGMRLFRSKMVDEKWTEEDVRKALKKSAEGKQTNTDSIITRAYQDILGRAPDQEGLKLYRKLMTEQGWNETKVRDALRKSGEAKNKKKK